jgi:hypothetical protein
MHEKVEPIDFDMLMPICRVINIIVSISTVKKDGEFFAIKANWAKWEDKGFRDIWDQIAGSASDLARGRSFDTSR